MYMGKAPLRACGSNHFNYAHFDLPSMILETYAGTMMTLNLSQYLESVTLYHTIQHFSALFLIPALRIDIAAHGGVIYFTLYLHFVTRFLFY